MLLECRIFRIVGVFGLFLGIQVIEIAEKLVEPMHGGKEFILVAQVVLAELARRIAKRFQQCGDCGILGAYADIGAGHSDLGEARADRILPGDEGGTASGATLLAIVVSESRALMTDVVNVRRAVTHLTSVVVAAIPPA